MIFMKIMANTRIKPLHILDDFKKAYGKPLCLLNLNRCGFKFVAGRLSGHDKNSFKDIA